MNAMRRIDPEAVAMRSKRKLQRWQYFSKV